MPLKPIVFIGAGGHCRSCIDVVESTGIYSIAGIIDTEDKLGQEIDGYKVIGTDKDYLELHRSGHQFLVTLGHFRMSGLRKEIFETLIKIGASFPTIVSPRAYVSKKASIGKGTIVMHGAFVNSYARVLDNTIINTGSAIEHDAIIGRHCHVSTYAIVNGGANLEDGVFAGSACVIINGVNIVAGSILGAGAVIHKSITEKGTYVGNPFRKIA